MTSNQHGRVYLHSYRSWQDYIKIRFSGNNANVWALLVTSSNDVYLRFQRPSFAGNWWYKASLSFYGDIRIPNRKVDAGDYTTTEPSNVQQTIALDDNTAPIVFANGTASQVILGNGELAPMNGDPVNFLLAEGTQTIPAGCPHVYASSRPPGAGGSIDLILRFYMSSFRQGHVILLDLHRDTNGRALQLRFYDLNNNQINYSKSDNVLSASLDNLPSGDHKLTLVRTSTGFTFVRDN